MRPLVDVDRHHRRHATRAAVRARARRTAPPRLGELGARLITAERRGVRAEHRRRRRRRAEDRGRGWQLERRGGGAWSQLELPTVGEVDGLVDGDLVGIGGEGLADGENDGDVLGLALGDALGLALGLALGDLLGDREGELLGDALGLEDGLALGESLGLAVGFFAVVFTFEVLTRITWEIISLINSF